jgi:hypothetical protein
MRMGIFTKRDVKKDEELTFNYNVDRYGLVLVSLSVDSSADDSITVTMLKSASVELQTVSDGLVGRLRRTLG